MAAPAEDSPHVPPHDLDAEAALLSAVLIQPANLDGLSLLPEHFFSEAHRRIYEAALFVRGEGRPVNVISVGTRLKEADRLAQVGGMAYLTEVLNSAPAVTPREVQDYERTIRDRFQRRQLIVACQGVTARAYVGNDTTPDLLDLLSTSVQALGQQNTNASPFAPTGDLEAPLPSIPYLVPALGIAPGPPTLVAGYGYSRKTLALQSLVLSVLSGRPLWGVYATERGRAVHLDYEQGRHLTIERYQRLARAMDLAPGWSAGLSVVPYPRMYLDDANAERELVRALTGARVCLLDSLRGAIPNADENASEVRRYLDLLSRVSERTGCCILVIHHARKPSEDSGSEGQKFAIRGSSALFDASASVFVFEGAKNSPTRVHHHKDRTRGICVEPFGLDSKDISDGINPRWGLLVEHLDPEQMRPESKHDAVMRDLRIRVVDIISRSPGITQRRVRAEAGGRSTSVDAILEELEQGGRIEVTVGPRKALAYRVRGDS